MAIKGSLKAAGLGDVCQLLSIGQKTGCLSVTDRSRFGQIFFDGGRITFATIVNRRDRLGDMLIRDGTVTPEQIREAVDAQAQQPDRRLGELLLERGYIDQPTLTSAIRRQIEDAIWFLLTWPQGNFYFEPGRMPDRGELLISVNPETLLLEGARRVDEWSVIEQLVPSMDVIFEVDRDRIRDADPELTEPQRRLVERMDGTRTAEELAAATGLGEFEAGKALYGLARAGLVTRSGRGEDRPPDPAHVAEARNLGIAFYRTAMLDDAEREFRRVLEADPSDDDARHRLALIALRRGELAEAVRRLSTLLESGGPRLGVYLNLAHALRQQRRFEDAVLVLDQARALDDRDPRVPLALSAVLLFADDLAGAEVALADYRALLDPDETPPPTYHYCAALVALVDGRFDPADRLLAEGLAAHPGAAPLHLLAGNVAERRGDAEAAERAYRRAAEGDSPPAQVHRNLGDVLARRGALGEAVEHYERAAELAPTLGDALYTRLAALHYRAGRRGEAVRCWQRAVELNPDNDVARDRLEVVARAGG